MTLNFPVSAAKLEALRAAMERLGVDERDLDEAFVRSSGPGGQNVNKVATCVVLTHRPTGLTIRYQVSRHQALNRFMARRLLVDELEARTQGAESARRRLIWKVRKQKARRSRRAKDKMLRDKHLHAEKKSLRRPPDF